MKAIRFTLAALLLATAVPVSGQTATSKTLDERLQDAVDTRRITGRVVALAIAQARADAQAVPNAADAALRAAINRQRTDLQMGSAPSAPQAVSILEKPGIPDLLSLAIDRGVITKGSSGAGITLSTTPYAVWTGFGATDTPGRWKSATVARNLGFSATFASSDAAEGDFSSFNAGEVKYVVFGNRSPRDPELLAQVRQRLGRVFLVADADFDRACGPLVNSDPVLGVEAEMNRWLRDQPELTVAGIRAHLLELVRPLQVDPEPLRACTAAVLAGEQLIQGGLEGVTAATRKYLAENPHQLSVAALFVRDATLSDYYSAKLLYAFDREVGTLNLNGEASWNKDSETPSGLPLRSLRSYSAELGFTSRTFANGRLDGSLSAKASRDKSLDARSLVIGEAKLNLHLTSVLQLPFSLTYANRETLAIQQGWQFNVGVNALLDEVLRQLGAPQL
jgi:hypothetical protein